MFQTVSLDDLKPPPVLWHEDTGRRPLENGRYLIIWPTLTSINSLTLDRKLLLIHDTPSRQNPPGSFSGRQLGEAAHRLVKNSLQVRAGQECGDSEQRRHNPHSSYSFPYPNGRHHSFDKHPPAQPQQYNAVSSSAYRHERSENHQFERREYGSRHRDLQHGTGSRHWEQRPPAPSHPSYVVPVYPVAIVRQPVHGSFPPRSGYRGDYGGFGAYGAQQPWNPQYDPRRGPSHQPPYGRTNPNPNLQQINSNRYVVLDRDLNKRPRPPPPPGYGRY